MDATRILETIKKYKKDLENYEEEMGKTQAFIQKNKIQIETLTEEMKDWIEDIREVQNKWLGATEAIKALEDLV